MRAARPPRRSRSNARSRAQRAVAVDFTHLDPRRATPRRRSASNSSTAWSSPSTSTGSNSAGRATTPGTGGSAATTRSQAILTVVDGQIAGTITLSRHRGTHHRDLPDPVAGRTARTRCGSSNPSGFPSDHPPGSEGLQAPRAQQVAVARRERPRRRAEGRHRLRRTPAPPSTSWSSTASRPPPRPEPRSAPRSSRRSTRRTRPTRTAASRTRLHLVHVAAVAYNESGNFNTDLNRLTSGSDGYMDNVRDAAQHPWRRPRQPVHRERPVLRPRLDRPERQLRLFSVDQPRLRVRQPLFRARTRSQHRRAARPLRRPEHLALRVRPRLRGASGEVAHRDGLQQRLLGRRHELHADPLLLESEPHLRQPGATAGHRLDLRQRARAQPERLHGRQFPQLGTSGCSYTLSPGSVSVGAAATSGSVGVTTGAGCPWSTTSSASWLTVGAGRPPAAAAR